MDVILFIEKRFVIESNRENFYGEIIKENSGYAVRKDEKKYVKVLEYVCHITVWCVILLIPLFIDSNLSMSELNIPDYLKHCLIPVSFCILFYINYLYLVPRFLFKGKIVAYVGLDLLIIVAFSLIMPLLGQFVINPDAVPPPDVAILEQLPPKPLNMAFIMGRDIFTMILISGLAASLRMGRKIASIEDARKESEMTNLKSQFNPTLILNKFSERILNGGHFIQISCIIYSSGYLPDNYYDIVSRIFA